MATPAPNPLDALRQHTQAVVLTSPDGEVSPALMAAIRDSGVPCELIGHPLVAMAELARLERDLRGGASGERTALIVSDRDQWDDLSLLFEAVRERLSRVSIWILAGQLAIEVHRGRAGEVAPRAGELASRAGELAPRAGELAPRAGELALRAGELALRAGEPASRAGEPPSPAARSFEPVTSRTPPGRPSLRIVEPQDAAPPRDVPAAGRLDDDESIDENADTRSAEAVTSAEIEMLLDLFDGPDGDARGGTP